MLHVKDLQNKMCPIPLQNSERDHIHRLISLILINVYIHYFFALYRSIEKDFKNAQFSQDHVESWRAFLQNPFSHRDESWPLFSLLEHSTTASVSTTLSEKEQQLVESYKAKRNEFKEVKYLIIIKEDPLKNNVLLLLLT